ncbi:MAG: basic amino acid/polyamine antiporter, APA family [Chloroflexi bacterium]|nr:MAG: basic amino acid/polyamine antiporter, APA family [Chloroflexota bacterium]
MPAADASCWETPLGICWEPSPAATANTALLLLMASCRRIYAMASAGALPRRLATISGGTGVPITGLAMTAVLAALVSPLGDLGTIADITNFALFVAFTMVNASLILLRRRHPHAARPFRVPGSLPLPGWGAMPLLPRLGIATSALLIVNLDQDAILGGLAPLATGILLAWIWRAPHRRAAAELAKHPDRPGADRV